MRLDHPYSASAQFYTWLPDEVIRSGDVVVAVEADSRNGLGLSARADYPVMWPNKSWWHRVREALTHWRDWRPRAAIAT